NAQRHSTFDNSWTDSGTVFYLDAPKVRDYDSTHCSVVGGSTMPHRFDRLVLLLTVLLLAASTSFGHHSVSGQFDPSKSLTLKGVISKVEWINPHIYVFLDVKETDGTVVTWALETLPTAMMRKAGLSKESVMGQPGEIVTVVANPGRDATRRLGWILKITYADGRNYQLGGSPNGQ